MKNKKNFNSLLENFWYYYKYHTFALLFVLFLLTIFIKDKTSQIHYDYKIAVLTEQEVPDQYLKKLEKSFRPFASDLNKNGKIQIEILNYVTSKDNNINPQVELANQTKLMSDMSDGDSMIYIYSDKAYNSYKNEGIFDVPDGKQTKLSSCKGNQEDKLNNLNISMRIIKGTMLEKKKDKTVYYKDSKTLLERFKKGS